MVTSDRLSASDKFDSNLLLADGTLRLAGGKLLLIDGLMDTLSLTGVLSLSSKDDKDDKDDGLGVLVGLRPTGMAGGVLVLASIPIGIASGMDVGITS